MKKESIEYIRDTLLAGKNATMTIIADNERIYYVGPNVEYHHAVWDDTHELLIMFRPINHVDGASDHGGKNAEMVVLEYDTIQHINIPSTYLDIIGYIDAVDSTENAKIAKEALSNLYKYSGTIPVPQMMPTQTVLKTLAQIKAEEEAKKKAKAEAEENEDQPKDEQ